jgi:predicted ester cyclase
MGGNLAPAGDRLGAGGPGGEQGAGPALLPRKAIVERDSSACERLLTVDFVHNGEPRGRAGQRQAVDYFLAAIPDLEHEIELILAEDDLVAAHQRWAGTHGGELLGVEATGRRIEFTSTAILRVRDALIAEAWDELDSGAILAQLR